MLRDGAFQCASEEGNEYGFEWVFLEVNLYDLYFKTIQSGIRVDD